MIDMKSLLPPIMKDTADNLFRSFDTYWPFRVSNGSNLGSDPDEKNLTIHLARVFLCRGYSVYAECPYPGTKEDLDLLAIDPSRELFIACELKKAKNENTDGPKDSEKIKKYWLTNLAMEESINPIRASNGKICKTGYALVARVIWNKPGRMKDYYEHSCSDRTWEKYSPILVRENRGCKVDGDYYLHYMSTILQNVE